TLLTGPSPWPEEAVDDAYGLYSLHRMFDIVGAQLTHRDVRVLSFLFVDVIDEYERGGIRSGRDFLLALERQGRCDETNFRHVLQLLRIITRHDLLPYVTLRKRQTGLYSFITLQYVLARCTSNVLQIIFQCAQIQWINTWRRRQSVMFLPEEQEKPSRELLTEEQVGATSGSQTCPGPQPCTFCMSLSSITPDSTHQLISGDCKT
uniref:Death effector domain-containing protein n=1 Tax=Sinocyclocheilus grahami TaxID=75366 RepID=A0A672P9B5_SINGR